MFRVNRPFNWSICGDRHTQLQGYLQGEKGAQFNQKKISLRKQSMTGHSEM